MTSYTINLGSTKSFSAYGVLKCNLAPLVAIIPNDPNLEDEVKAARDAGFRVHRISVLSRATVNISYEDIIPLIAKPSRAIYRGFMLTDETYSVLARDLKELFSTVLLVSPQEYSTAHYFPQNYMYLSLYSPRATWCACPPDCNVSESSFADVVATVRTWGCSHVMLKDYVKSAKDITTTFTKVSTSSHSELCELASLLVDARGSRFNKGIVFKEYFELKYYHVRSMIVTNEWRCFFGPHGKMLSMDTNSSQCDPRKEVIHGEGAVSLPSTDILTYITSAAKLIGSPYITIDIAEKSDGSWFVLEAGDGGVSGPATGQDLASHWRQMYCEFENYLPL